LALDQVTKWWLLVQVFRKAEGLTFATFTDLMLRRDDTMSQAGTTLADVPPFFKLVLAWNYGISFSLFRSDSPAAPWIFAGIALAIVTGLLLWLRRMDRGWPAIAVGLIIGGAFGNVIDRIRFRAVVDFLYFHWGEYYWPAFNAADAAITVGVAMLLIDGLFGRTQRAKKAPS
jgi:signal peptidase II